MRKTIILLFLPLLTGCEYFETRKISSEEVLEQETKSLNWKQVDEYPAFEHCENIKELSRARECFERTVADSIYAQLAKQQPVVTEPINDTLMLYLEITKTGRPVVDSISADSTTIRELPDIKRWLRQSVDSLPKIYPASKRGIPVSTKFKMPIVVKAE